MSLTVDEIQKTLREAGALIAELNSMPPEHTVKSVTLPAAPIAFYKRSTLIKPQQPAASASKQMPEAARKIAPQPTLVKDASAIRKTEAVRKQPETARG
jgi:hypothetical protein